MFKKKMAKAAETNLTHNFSRQFNRIIKEPNCRRKLFLENLTGSF